jgi:HlyD family secretion protein
LFKKGLASSADVDKARADFDGATARLGSARERHIQATGSHEEALNNLSKTTLVSPIDGSVIQLSREVGERVRGSDFSEDVVMILAALTTMEVKVEVGEHEVVYLQPGQKADIIVDALEGQTFAGRVTEIAQNALIKNPGTEAEVTSFPVKVALDARPPGTLPGMTAEVRVAAEMHPDTIVVPIQSVTVRAEKNLPDAKMPVEGSSTALVAKKRGDTLAKVVFVVGEDNRVHVRRVRTGIASESEIEILDGVQVGERVIEGPYRTLAKDLKDGDPVREVEPGKVKFGPGRS